MIGIVRSKFFAILIGAFGVGVISQILNFNSIIVFTSAVGIPLSLTKFVSIWEKEGLWADIKLIVSQFNTLLFSFGIVFTIINIVLASEISIFLFGDEQYYYLIIIISLSLPLSLVNPILEGLLKGLKRFKQYVKISIFISIFCLLVTLLSVFYFKIVGAVFSLSVSSVIVFLVYYIYFYKIKVFNIYSFFSFNFRYSDKFKIVVKLGLASLAVGLADQISQLLIRTFIIKAYGVNANGLYQSIYSISMNYFNILFMSLGIYLLPVLSEMKDKNLINSEINNTLKFSFIIIVPLVSSIFIFRDFVIRLLYSEEFLPSIDLLFFNFLGDYLKAFSWVIGAWLIPLSRIRAWLVFSFIYYINYILLFLLFSTVFDMGLKSVVISYFISYLIHSFINLYFIIKNNKFKFSTVNLKLFPLSILFILIMMFISDYKQIYGYVIILPSLLLWLKLTVSKVDLFRIIELFKSKMLNYKL